MVMNPKLVLQRNLCKQLWTGGFRTTIDLVRGGERLIIYSDGPLWVRALIAFGAAALFCVLAWRYYVHFWRRR
jgi:hypothetical protein